MNASLDHLPQRKRDELAQVVALIRQKIAAASVPGSDELEMVVLFGSYARGDWRDERNLPSQSDRKSGHVSDYDILVITRSSAIADDSALWSQVNAQLLRMPNFSTYARVIVHDVESLNKLLREGRYFYVDIVEQGRILHDSGRAKLAQPKALSGEERYHIAKEYYDHWSKMANAFFNASSDASARGELELAAFQLHQAAEAAYKLVLLVTTGYSPDEHYLALLASLAEREAPQLAGIFPISKAGLMSSRNDARQLTAADADRSAP